MDEELKKMDVQWHCPKCDAINLDNYYLTARPSCETCENRFEWDDFLTQEQFDTLNPLLIARAQKEFA